MAFDVFVSYRRKDADHVLPLVAALRQHGVEVWLDQSEIGEFAPITDKIRQGLAESKALLAWYSEEYPRSRPCQMELTAALVAAQREGDPRRRVFVINPSMVAAHIEPVELRDAQYAAAPSDTAGYDTLAQRVAGHVQDLGTPLGGILPTASPNHYGLKLTGANRFVGRLPDLWRIHSALHAGDSAIITGATGPGLAIVSGLGGVGKSLLAEEYALRFGAAYRGGIFWLRAHGNDETHASSPDVHEQVRIEQFIAMAVAFGIETKGLTPDEIEARLRARLSHEAKPFLWVVDDLARGLDANGVRAWLAPHPLGRTLVTTRSREYGAIGTPLALGVLKPHESFALLCSRRQPMDAVEEAAALGIAQDLGHHALAIDVAAAALATQAGLVSFAEFRSNLANPTEDELELAAELADMLPSGHQSSVAATILRSVRDLPEEGKDFLRLAALLDVEPIPPSMVVAVFKRVDSLTESQAKRRAIRAHQQVENASLAERREKDARLVHVLVSRTIRFHDASFAHRTTLRAATVDVLGEILLAVADIRTQHILTFEVMHSRALLDGMGPWDVDAANLADWVAQHDIEQGRYSVARGLQERGLEARRRILGDEHGETLKTMGNLAMTLGAIGELTGARALHERVIEVQRRVLGDEHRNTLRSMHNLALILGAQGDVSGARTLQERVMEAERRVLGDDHRNTLTCMSNLAMTLQVQGHLADARAMQEHVLEVQRRVLGDEHGDTLLSMNNLATTLATQGDLARARTLLERVLEAHRRVLGDEHRDTLAIMRNLVWLLWAQWNLASAGVLCELMIEAQRRVLGDEHPDTLASMYNLAMTLAAQGNLAGASTLYERVLGAQSRVLGEEHRDTLASLRGLAVALESMGDLARARALQERVRETRPGDKHGDTLTNMRSLGDIFRPRWAWDDTPTLQARIREAADRVLNDQKPPGRPPTSPTV